MFTNLAEIGGGVVENLPTVAHRVVGRGGSGGGGVGVGGGGLVIHVMPLQQRHVGGLCLLPAVVLATGC